VWLTINLTWSNAEFYHCSTSCGHSAQFVGEIDDYALLANFDSCAKRSSISALAKT